MAETFSIAGAHLKCFINGKLLGYVIAVPSWNIRSEWAELRGIDNVMAKQLVPRIYSCSGTVQILRGRHTGGLEGAGLVPSGEAMLRQKYLTVEIQDRITQDIIYRALLCQIDQQQWQMDTKGLVTGSFSFKGLSFQNEATR
jgi:hypothetical protein